MLNVVSAIRRSLRRSKKTKNEPPDSTQEKKVSSTPRADIPVLPVPAPRSSKHFHSIDGADLDLDVDESMDLDGDGSASRPASVVEVIQPAANGASVGHSLFDSLEHPVRDNDEDHEHVDEEPRIFIGKNGEWMVGDADAKDGSSRNSEEDEKGTKEDGAGKDQIKQCVRRLGDLLEVYDHEPTVLASVGDERRESDDEDIPDDWKESEAAVPMMRCVQVEEASSSPSSSAASSDEDEEPQMEMKRSPSKIMEVIEELDEDKTTATEEEEDEDEVEERELQMKAPVGVGHSSADEVSDDEMQQLRQRSRSPNITQSPPANIVESTRIERGLVDSSDDEPERVSPDTVASNDSGVVDAYGNHTADSYFTKLPPPPLVEETNVSVRSIARFWEDVTKRQKAEDEAAPAINKKWMSMPDLKDKKKAENKIREEPRILEEETLSRSSSTSSSESDLHAALEPKFESEHDANIVRAIDEIDDRSVCGNVSISERKRMFERLAEDARRERRSQWTSLSMPSLAAAAAAAKSKDTYMRNTYEYARKKSEQNNAVKKLQQQPAPPAQKPAPAATPKSPRVSTSSQPPIPLVSSTSKESEDFDLTPIRDRMRAFQAPGKEPVSKPVVSVNKTVSSPGATVEAEASRKKSKSSVGSLSNSSNNNTGRVVSNNNNSSSRKSSHVEAKSHRKDSSRSGSYNVSHDLDSLDLQRQPHSLEDEGSCDSMASSHTSSSTVISASKKQSPSALHATYSWNDESNGEIYNDRHAHAASSGSSVCSGGSGSAADETPAVLYVVENGKEFPLTPVSRRKSFFQSTENVSSYHSPSLPKDILRCEPMIVDDKKRKSSSSAVVVVPVVATASSDGCSCAGSNSCSDSCSEGEDDEPVKETAAKETVKSANVPYIEEEQQVLKSINLVQAMKAKFVAK